MHTILFFVIAKLTVFQPIYYFKVKKEKNYISFLKSAVFTGNLFRSVYAIMNFDMFIFFN